MKVKSHHHRVTQCAHTQRAEIGKSICVDGKSFRLAIDDKRKLSKYGVRKHTAENERRQDGKQAKNKTSGSNKIVKKLQQKD